LVVAAYTNDIIFPLSYRRLGKMPESAGFNIMLTSC
jgi:hypothetical protein